MTEPNIVEDAWLPYPGSNLAGRTQQSLSEFEDDNYCTIDEINEAVDCDERSGSILNYDSLAIRTPASRHNYPVFAYRNDQGEILRVEINLNPYDIEEAEWFETGNIDEDTNTQVEELFDDAKIKNFSFPKSIRTRLPTIQPRYAVINSDLVLHLVTDEPFFIDQGDTFKIVEEVMVHNEPWFVLEDGSEESEPFLLEQIYCRTCFPEQVETVKNQILCEQNNPN